MKKTSLCVALAALTLSTACNKQTQTQSTVVNPTSSTTVPSAPQTARIAYVEIDTLMAQYQLCKDYNEIGNTESENIQRTLANKQRALEQHFAAVQQKYESNGFTNQEEFNRAQAKLQKEQQELQELNARLTTSFQEQQLKYTEEMRDSIQKFLKSYNKDKRYDIVFSKAGDNILYANPAFDITQDVLKGLNKRYKVRPEIAVKLKGKKTKTEFSNKKK